MKKFGEKAGANRANFKYIYLRDALNAVSLSLMSGSVLSAFLVYGGMPEDRISFYLAFVPLVNLVVSLAFSGITSRVRDTVRGYTVPCVISGVLTASFVVLCLMDASTTWYFVLLMALGSLLSAATAVRTIFDYKQPCEVMDVGDYSVYVSVNGIITGVVGMSAGALLSLGYGCLPFMQVSAAAFLLSGLTLVCAGLANNRMKILHKVELPEERRSNLDEIKATFRDRDFRALIAPNLIRGVGMGVISMITVLALRSVLQSESDGAIITICTYVGTLASCLLYAFLAKKFGVLRLSVIGGSICMLLSLGFFFGRLGFFAIYTAAYIGYYIVCCVVPDIVYRNVRPEIISSFHVWRIALTTGGTVISTAVIGALINVFDPSAVLAAGAISLLICAVWYSVYYSSAAHGVR